MFRESDNFFKQQIFALMLDRSPHTRVFWHAKRQQALWLGNAWPVEEDLMRPVWISLSEFKAALNDPNSDGVSEYGSCSFHLCEHVINFFLTGNAQEIILPYLEKLESQ